MTREELQDRIVAVVVDPGVFRDVEVVMAAIDAYALAQRRAHPDEEIEWRGEER